jgi:ketosteroid isomerase-like protein
MGNANVEVVQGLYAAFGRGDIGALTSALGACASWEVVGRPSDFPTLGRREGPAGVQSFFEEVGRQLTFSEFAPAEFYAVDDKVFVLGHYAMTVNRTGRALDSDFIHVFTLHDGKVCGFREFTDTAKAAEAYRG